MSIKYFNTIFFIYMHIEALIYIFKMVIIIIMYMDLTLINY